MSPVVFDSGCVTIVCSEILVVGPVVQHMPYCDEQFACYCHEDFHLVLLSDLRLMEGEAAEEAVPGPACSPCTFDDGLAEKYISMSNPARLDLLVGLVVPGLQPAP